MAMKTNNADIYRLPDSKNGAPTILTPKRSERIVFLSGARTPFCRVGGSLKDFGPMELGAIAARAAIERAKLTDRIDEIDACIFGNGMHTSIDSHYGARHVGLLAGLSHFSTALTVNRICWSGGEAIVQAARELLLGEINIAVAGGYESTSQSPLVMYGAAYGFQYMAGPSTKFLFKDGLNDTFINDDMMGTSENVARRYNLTREELDQFALCSQQKAHRRTPNRQWEITPVEVRTGKTTNVIAEDDNLKSDTTLKALARLPAVKPGGVHTAGNSSGIVDGAAAVVLTTEKKAKELGIEPIGELLSWAVSGVDPHYMGLGPVPSSYTAMKRAGFKVSDVQQWEINEAFSGQSLACVRELEIDPEIVNVNGGAIALGHPLGATGARLVISLLGLGGIGVASACIGGGQGGAMVIRGYAS